jgi:hypothetical protein
MKPTTKVVTLGHIEARIEKNWGRLMIVGLALEQIRRKREYPQHSWRDYCRERWKKSHQALDFLIGGAVVAKQLKLSEDFPITRLRPLMGLSEPNRLKAWEDAKRLCRDPNVPPSAALIKMAAAKYKNKPLREWELGAAQEQWYRLVKRATERVLGGASRAQVREFVKSLPGMCEHFVAMTGGDRGG